eukprot:2325903-Alexandrium_andersonii.AAC.1
MSATCAHSTSRSCALANTAPAFLSSASAHSRFVMLSGLTYGSGDTQTRTRTALPSSSCIARGVCTSNPCAWRRNTREIKGNMDVLTNM